MTAHLNSDTYNLKYLYEAIPQRVRLINSTNDYKKLHYFEF